MATNQSVKRLQAILALLPEQMKAPVRAQVFSQAEVLRRAMILKVPVEPGGGTLRDSIRVEPGRNEMRALVKAGGPATTVGGYDYAAAQEWGTAKQPAQPFFWVSYRSKKRQIRTAIKATIKVALQVNWRD